MYYAPGATHAPHHVPEGVVGQVQGQVRRGLGQAARGDVRAAEEAGRDPEGRGADAAAEGDPRLGRHAGRAQAGAGARDGDLRRLSRADRSPRRPRHRGAARTSDVLDDTLVYLHHRRQRRVGRGLAERLLQRDDDAQRDARASRRRSSCSTRSTTSARPTAYNHYAVGWAHAMCTPYQWTKQVASHWGGTRNGTIVHWPNGIDAKGEIRIAVPPRDRRGADRAGGGRPARARDGQRHRAGAARGRQHGATASTTREAPERHDLQYFEMFGNRGLYHQGWTAVTKHSTPWTTDAAAARSTPTSGSSTRPTTGRRRTTSSPSIRRSSPSCSGCG